MFGKLRLLTAVAAAMFVISGFAVTAEAQNRNEREVRDTVRALKSRLDDLENNLRFQMQSNSDPNELVMEVQDLIRDVRDRMREFEQNLDRRRENRSDARAVIDAAQRVQRFLEDNPQNQKVMDNWMGVRTSLDRLGANYGIVTRWGADAGTSGGYSQPMPSNTLSVGLSGTYELDRERSERIDDVLSGENLSDEDRSDLIEKLEAPEQLAIEIRGRQVTLTSSRGPAVSMTADGRDKIERNAAGATVRLRATLAGDTLTISSLGGDTDYTITFTSVSNGRVMKVSRRITTEYLRQTVFAESVYNKTDSVARLNIGGGSAADDDQYGGYSENDPPTSGTQSPTQPNTSTGRGPVIATTKPGNYIVPFNASVTALLENEIRTGVSQNNDRFRMTVQTPDEFRGAILEGYISNVNRSGRVSGRSNITFNFDKITLRDGTVYDFAGVLGEIRDLNGKVIKIDDEGSAKSDSQTKETAKRGGIGAGVGAIIGAIAGGAKGAAIGAVIGGSAGAGSVIVTGKEDIRLLPGTTFVVTSTSPDRSYR
ncbi:MAG: hypothetical protein KF881_02070 [Acidobacteria bacterium]|nr:hypothetical protein [Acidobacteriota bacterium]